MTIVKAMGAAAVAGALWLTANLGEAWWILLALLALDAVMNYGDEAAWLRRLGAYMLTTAVTAYARGGLGIAGLHAVVFGMVAYEAVRVGDRALILLRPLLRAPEAAVAAAALPGLITALQARVDALAAQMEGMAHAGQPDGATGGGAAGAGRGLPDAVSGAAGRGGDAPGGAGAAPGEAVAGGLSAGGSGGSGAGSA